MYGLCTRALAAGAQPEGYSMTWDRGGDCSSPSTIPLVSQLANNARFVKRHHQVIVENPVEGTFKVHSEVYWDLIPDFLDTEIKNPFFLNVIVRCRRCEKCRALRSRQWAARATIECNRAVRTWFCTYTLSPDWRFRATLEAGSNQYDQIARIVGKWFTKYLKRVRKRSRAPIRFMLAFEQHKDGMVHLHALIHEPTPSEVSKSILQSEWPYGFTVCKLCDSQTARYVTKYISKGLQIRVRASLRYGKAVNVTL